MEFGQINTCAVWQTFLTCFWLNAGDWFYDFIPFLWFFLKWEYIDIWSFFNRWDLPFLVVPYSPLQKMKHRNLDIIGYWVIDSGY